MIGVLQTWWTGLSVRERILVAIAGMLASGLLSWFLIVTPLQAALTSAADAHSAALDRQAAVRSRIAALTGPGNPAAAAASAPVTQAVAAAASEAGLPLARNDPAGDGGAAIAISNGRSGAVLALLAALEAQRIRPSELVLSPNGDGSISLTTTLRRSGS